jgi:hypothetical protein
LTDEYITGINMTLTGISSFSGGAQSTWIKVTQDYISQYFAIRTGLKLTINHLIITYQSSEVIFSNSGRRRGRGLQTGTPSVIVTYNQEFGFKSEDPSITPDYVVSEPFVGDTSVYRTALQQNSKDFTGLTSVSAVSVPGAVNSITGNNNNNSGLSNTAKILIYVGAGVIALLLLLALCYYMSSQKGRRLRRGYLAKKDNDDAPPTQLQLGVGADEVSTLAEPQTQTKMGRGAHESIAGYGDQR